MKTPPQIFRPLDPSGVLSWVHFGDLHLTRNNAQNYQDFLALIEDANTHLAGADGVNFAFLPGDNADNGSEAQYRLLRDALDGLRLPVHALPGDHDLQSGTLDHFRRWLEPVLTRSVTFGPYRCVFLNSVDTEGKEGFDFGEHQLAYLEGELEAADQVGQKTVLFMHTYPSELGHTGKIVASLIRRHRNVRLVEMGHTHYNEIANDGRVIYAATRSTGQIEEGPVGFSLTCLDGNVVSWKFKPLTMPWPFAMITSPADRAFLTETAQAVRGTIEVRAKAWSGRAVIARAACRVDDGALEPMARVENTATWDWKWDSTSSVDGLHRLTVRAETSAGDAAEDAITVLVSQSGHREPPLFHAVDMENTIGAYPEKGLFGTQLGPNKNGRSW